MAEVVLDAAVNSNHVVQNHQWMNKKKETLAHFSFLLQYFCKLFLLYRWSYFVMEGHMSHQACLGNLLQKKQEHSLCGPQELAHYFFSQFSAPGIQYHLLNYLFFNCPVQNKKHLISSKCSPGLFLAIAHMDSKLSIESAPSSPPINVVCPFLQCKMRNRKVPVGCSR